MNILFTGTPGFSLPSLHAIHQSTRHRIVAVLTNPDAPRGRGKKLMPPPVKEAALQLGLPVIQPEKLGASAREMVAGFEPDIMAVVAYGKIFGPKFLELFPRGALNLHPSLLPKYRGPAPIPAAILAGDRVSGITVQRLGLEMDAGDLVLQEKMDIPLEANALELTDEAAKRGAHMLVNALDLVEDHLATFTPQDNKKASYCRLLKKEDGIIDWNSSAMEIHNKIRAFVPWPNARSSWAGSGLNLLESHLVETADEDRSEPGQVLGVDKSRGILVQTGNGVLALSRLQLHTKKAADWKSFINGNPEFLTARLGG